MASTPNQRKTRRLKVEFTVTLTWIDARQCSHTVEARGTDLSTSGLRVISPEACEAKTKVLVQAHRYCILGEGIVRYCLHRGSSYHLGIELSTDAASAVRVPEQDRVDYYEVLQISPLAEPETVTRVYRMLAARFHPDNAETGDEEKFIRLTQAYNVLSDPERRHQYDLSYYREEYAPLPIFELSEFVNGVSAEANRRMGLLCLLYNHRRYRPEHPGVSLLQFERMMGIPREHLTFTLWYLREKGLVAMIENSDFALTAAGVDYVETNAGANRVVARLLEAPASQRSGPARASNGAEAADAAAV